MKKPGEASPLENPVLHFSSAVYKCENQVMRLFSNGAANLKTGEKRIMDGLVLCLQEHVPAEMVLAWLHRQNVRDAHVWAIQYTKIQGKQEISTQVVEKRMTWNTANDHASRPRMARQAPTVERNLIHRLAVYTVKKERDEKDIVRKYLAEVEAVRGKNYHVDG